ncbi:hypothetical protein ABC969_06525 [Sphingomonas qilianensis]|uniref:Uncharacterized protein n=1 Tax=Sphingomonas qilianensis TaxID=1736690 RepID=A0ABU9XRB2_9SPHN
MADPRKLTDMFSLPPHLVALQMLVDRCPDAVSRKWLIVTAGSCEAIDRHEGFVMVTANMLETA